MGCCRPQIRQRATGQTSTRQRRTTHPECKPQHPNCGRRPKHCPRTETGSTRVAFVQAPQRSRLWLRNQLRREGRRQHAPSSHNSGTLPRPREKHRSAGRPARTRDRQCTNVQTGPVAGARQSETVHRKPSFRTAFQQRRCIVPIDGWYEWRTEDDVRRPTGSDPRTGTSSRSPAFGRPTSGNGAHGTPCSTWMWPAQDAEKDCEASPRRRIPVRKRLH